MESESERGMRSFERKTGEKKTERVGGGFCVCTQMVSVR